MIMPDISEKKSKNEIIQCHICKKTLDYITASVSQDPEDSIYICFAAIKQKIFVYGKYIGGKYGALSISKYFTKQECSAKKCETIINNILNAIGEKEYSRLITCNKGLMNAIILTQEMIKIRKEALKQRLFEKILHSPDGPKKYFCQKHANEYNYKCSCGDELLLVGSQQYGEITGMSDQAFVNRFIPEIINVNPFEDNSCK